MKFTDGYWQLRPGVSVLRPSGVDEVVTDDGRLTVFCPTAPIRRRGDTLHRPMIDGVTLEMYEPADGSERVLTVRGGSAAPGGARATATLVVRRTGDRLSVIASGTDQPWQVRVVGTDRSAAGVGAGEVTVPLG